MAGPGCPFCGYKAENEYDILVCIPGELGVSTDAFKYHMESLHPEGDSPFIPHDEANGLNFVPETDDVQDEDYVECPIDGCGESLFRSELDTHLDMHAAEADVVSDESHPSKKLKLSSASSTTDFQTKIPEALRNLNPEVSSTRASSESRQAKAKAGWKEILNMPNSLRSSHNSSSRTGHRKILGKSELGPHAGEKQMPQWLRKLLESDGEPEALNQLNGSGGTKKTQFIKNYASGILPVVEQLLEQDPMTEYAYTCHYFVQHVSKLKNEGGFCGYRNIQMICSYIIAAESEGHYHFKGRIPSIFQIQEYIERAWDLGINKQGRQETGGILGTRKYIGTPEAQAILCSFNISCEAQGMKGKDNLRAEQILLQNVEDYFCSGSHDQEEKIRRTNLPPLYFQHPGHSMTIVGVEKRKDGSMSLLVFDPMFHDAAAITRLVGKRFTHKAPAELLRAYRRGPKYLKKYKEFETLKLTPPKLTDR